MEATPAAVVAPALPAASGDIANTPPPIDPAAPYAAPAPTDPAKPLAAAAPANGQKHTVAAGDTFWDLAKKYLGDPTKWKLISEANPDARAKRLQIGGTLAIPAAN